MLQGEDYRRITRLLVKNDPTCISELYDAYSDALYGIIIRIVGSEEAASEILQDTFTKIWQKGHQYDPSLGRLFTWMSRIARNQAINHVHSKQSKKLKKTQGDEKLVYISDKARSAEKLEVLDLKVVVKSLNQKYVDVIELLYFKGYTQREASEYLEIPLGTVKSRLKIALRELKHIYDHRLAVTLSAGLLTLSAIS